MPYADLERAAAIVARLGAADSGLLVQEDTYYRASTGRLKLRRIEGRGSELIWYQRPDEQAVRASAYCVVPVADPGAMHQALAGALGCGVVAKRRRLFLWHNVRIHLDEVRGLGRFIEFEAVIEAGEDEEVSHRRLEKLSGVLGIDAKQTLAPSYSDLMGI